MFFVNLHYNFIRYDERKRNKQRAKISEQIAASSASNKHKIEEEESIEIFKNLGLIENI